MKDDIVVGPMKKGPMKDDIGVKLLMDSFCRQKAGYKL